MPSTKSKLAFAGVGCSGLTRAPERSAVELNVAACRMALDDCGIDPALIDGVALHGYRHEPLNVAAVLSALGVPNQPSLFDENNGLGSVVEAARMLDAGKCRAMLVCTMVDSISPISYPPMDPATGELRQPAGHHPGDIEFEMPYGLGFGMQRVGLYGRRYMWRYGIRPEQIGWLPVMERQNALRHPWSYWKTPLTIEEYLSSRWIAEPVRLLDCDMPANGAFAYVIAHKEIAKTLRHPPVDLLSWGENEEKTPLFQQQRAEQLEGISPLATAMYRDAKLSPRDIDFACLYDGWAYLTFLWLESLGLVGRGEAPSFIEGGQRAGIEGELPVNPHGAHLGQGRSVSAGNVIEAIEQIRGTAGERRIRRPANYAAVSYAYPGGAPYGVCAIFGRG